MRVETAPRRAGASRLGARRFAPLCGLLGNFELNAMRPITINNFLYSARTCLVLVDLHLARLAVDGLVDVQIVVAAERTSARARTFTDPSFLPDALYRPLTPLELETIGPAGSWLDHAAARGASP